MPSPENKLVTPLSIAIDTVLCIAFFLYMYTVVSTHVPSKDHRMVLFFGGSCSACMTLVFWLTLQMFRMVVKAQQRRDAAAK